MDLSCHLNLKKNHTQETGQPKRNSTVVKTGLFSFLGEKFLRLPRVALQLRCNFLGVRSTIQFHVFNPFWHKFLEAAVCCSLALTLVFFKNSS
jgi:hypothetical protein